MQKHGEQSFQGWRGRQQGVTKELVFFLLAELWGVQQKAAEGEWHS